MICAQDFLGNIGLPRLEARMLLEYVLDKPRAWVLAHDNEPLSAQAIDALTSLAARRLAGEPMAYLVQSREFMGTVFKVGPGVLIPRPETELLVAAALEGLAAQQSPENAQATSLVDLGTGSGAIAIAIALARPDVNVWATDYSAQALQIAQENALRLGASVQFVQGDWVGALTAGQKFEVIVANPPYIPQNDPHLNQGDLKFEPRLALTDEGDGLAALRSIIAGAPAYLQPGGKLWVEHGWDQAKSVRGLLTEAGLQGVVSRRDLAGIERISGGYL